MSSDKAVEALYQNKGSLLADIVSLIGIPSVTGERDQNEKALSFILSRAEAMGMRTQLLLDGRVGTVEFGSGSETVGILVHADVVPAGELSLWETPPFEGCIKEGFVRGRGAMDDKGPLIAALYAMCAVKNACENTGRRVRMIIGTMEEGVWEDMADYTANYPLPDCGFTPDGEFPLTNLEKGYADVTVSAGSEPTAEGRFTVLSLRAGDAVNTLPDTAEMELAGSAEELTAYFKRYCKKLSDPAQLSITKRGERLVVTARGRSVHSSTPGHCPNAIVRLMRFAGALPLQCGGALALAQFTTRYFGKEIHGKTLGIPVRGRWQNGQLTDRTTLTPTLLQTEGGRFTLNVNVRTRPYTALAELTGAFETAVAGGPLSFKVEGWQPPLAVSRNLPFVKLLARSYGEVTGSKKLYSLAFGTSYAKAMPRHVSFGPLFPGEEDSCHQANERISVQSLMKAAEIYTRALCRMTDASQPLL